MITANNEKATTGAKTTWLKKLGFAGFLFFLLKGLVWMAIAAAAWAGITW